MDDTETCRLCAEAVDLKPLRHYRGVVQHASSHSIYVVDKDDERGYSEYAPLHNAEQAAQVRWKLLELGFEIAQWYGHLQVGITASYWRGLPSPRECRTISDEYRLLAETLARHQKEEPKNG